MKPAAFKYVEVDTEDAVSASLFEYGGEARLLAGGQSLVPMMNFRVASPAVLIDLNPVASLGEVVLDRDVLTIGAMARYATIEDSSALADRCPLLHQAIGHVAHRAVRNRGTIGGSAALAYPGAEVPLVLVALDADIILRSKRGQRTLAVGEFIRGPLDTAISDDEYIKSVEIRLPAGTACSGFVETARRHGDFALAAAAVVLEPSSAGGFTAVRAAVSGGTATPVRLEVLEQELLGGAPSPRELSELIRAAIDSIEIVSDKHYPEEYRRHLLCVVLQRAFVYAVTKLGPSHA